MAGWGSDRAVVDDVFDDLVARYAEPHRHYHTLEHVAAVLRTADSLVDPSVERAPVRLAAWYHDVVYDPHLPGNEARSVVLAAAHLASLGAPADLVRECARLIEITDGHEVQTGDANAAALVDADLAVLATGPERYDRYRQAVRAEYAHLDDATFAAGRRQVLAALADRPFIFATPLFRTEREPRARANLHRELSQLPV